jgi:hypothetical protein
LTSGSARLHRPNRAPFFQMFMEVRVEGSKKRVVLILNDD